MEDQGDKVSQSTSGAVEQQGEHEPVTNLAAGPKSHEVYRRPRRSLAQGGDYEMRFEALRNQLGG